jgi:3-hydroxyacyl-[acyl-carrier-protein] dehydratase
MPPEPFLDLSSLDQSTVEVDREAIYRVNPHRYEFEQLDGIFRCDRQAGLIAGYRDVRDDEFWVRGHIPGRPIFPGALMMETAAQLVSYYAMTLAPGKGFLGFGGVDGVKFRGEVVPGQRVILLGRMVEARSRRVVGDVQSFVDGKMVFEGRITGMWMG